MPDARLSPRERLVLTAIIELYIATGEPVASQAVARVFADREGLSSATMRNVMATLGEAGLLEQPHTSAGRVPTAAAFRYYVEQITQPGRMAAGAQRLTGAAAAAARLAVQRGPPRADRRELHGRHQLATNTWSAPRTCWRCISSGLGVALASSTASQVLEHIHFSRLSTGRVLAVLVTQAGAVQDRVLALDRELTHVELETAARYLNENFRGWPIERIRAEVARRMEVEREAYRQMLASVEELCRKGALAGGEAGPAIFVDGMANLIAAEVDRERLRQMLLALEAKQRLVELLTAYVDGRQQEVRVVVGLDRGLPGHAGSGADRRSGPAGRRQPGHRRRHRAHPHPISGDDSGGALHRPALRAPAGSSRRLESAGDRQVAIPGSGKPAPCQSAREQTGRRARRNFLERTQSHVEAGNKVDRVDLSEEARSRGRKPQADPAARSCRAPPEGEIARRARPKPGPSGRLAPSRASRAEFDQLKAERDQLLDRLARLQAEFENARKRAERERVEFRDYATGSVVEQFLPVLDNFELALKSAGTARAVALRRRADRQADGGRSAPVAGDAGSRRGRGVRSPHPRGARLGRARRPARPARGRGDSPRLQAARAASAPRAGPRGLQPQTESE